MYRQTFIIVSLLIGIVFSIHAQVSVSPKKKPDRERSNINTPINPFKLRASSHEKEFNIQDAGGYYYRSPDFDPTWAQQFQNTLDYLINVSNIPGGSLAVYSPGQDYYYGVSGVSHDTISITPEMRFGIGSNTKLFIATVLLNLQEEGLLSLDDPIHQWLPHYDYIDSTATIRQMLAHQSGFFDYFNDNVALLTDSVYADTSRFWTVDEVMATIGQPHFAPGQGWGYSNTNYMLSAEVIEAASGNDWVDMLHSKIFDPLILDSTFVGAYEPRNGPVAAALDVFTGEFIVNPPMTAEYSMMHAAGGILSAAVEMTSWYKSLFSEEIINSSSLQEMLDFEPAFYYGLGICGIQYQGNFAYMHTGGTLGYLSMMWYDVKTKTIMCILYNGRDAVPAQLGALIQVLYDDFPRKENDAGISSIMVPWANVCNESFGPKVVLQNYGSELLNSTTIHYFMDEDPPLILNWSGALSIGDTVHISLDNINATEGHHSFTCYTSQPNGQPEGYFFNDTAKSYFIINSAGGAPLPLAEDFEEEPWPPDGWSLGSNSTFNWRSNINGDYGGEAAAMKNNYQDGSIGTFYDLDLPLLNISGDNAALQFSYAYANAPSNNFDSLQVMISEDCGITWEMLFNKGGFALNTAAATYDPFYPKSQGYWDVETIPLDTYQGDVVIRFRAVCGASNNLYLDDILVDYAIGTKEIQEDNTFSIYPNPTGDRFTVRTTKNGYLDLLIYDITGCAVLRLDDVSNEQIDVSDLPSGLYFIEFDNGDERVVKKLIVK